MKVFLSWSGSKSQRVALALREWLPAVINNIEPFVSSKDIYAGSRWQAEIADELEATDFGIVCVTAENQASTWLNFEAGALAKSVEASRVVPLAIDLTPADIAIPLGQFQAQPATQEGFAALLVSINQHCEPPLSDTLLARSVSKWWPDLDRALTEINAIAPVVEQPHGRTDRELLEELLDTVRSIARTSDAGASATPTGTHDVLLTHRERLVLTQLARGRSTEEIAAELMLSQATVRNYIKNLLHKFNVRSRRELLAVAGTWEGTSGDGLHP